LVNSRWQPKFTDREFSFPDRETIICKGLNFDYYWVIFELRGGNVAAPKPQGRRGIAT